MNEALRLLRRLVRRWGYDMVRAPAYVLRPVPNLASLPHGGDLRATRDWFDAADGAAKADPILRLTVYLRTCLRKQRNVSKRPRLTGISDADNALRCLASTVRAINIAVREGAGKRTLSVIVLDDRSDAAPLARLRLVLETLACPWELRQTRERGQGPSLYEQFSDARGRDGLVYFCEDDFLHEPDAITEMWDFYDLIHRLTGGHTMLYPQEHKDLYESLYPSYILAGPTRRWRTTNDATHTFFTHGTVVETYWPYFENTKYMGLRSKKRHLASEKKTTNRIFDHIPGFSPIPAVALHMQYEELLPPFYEWKPLWESTSRLIAPEQSPAPDKG